jgi:thioredoxin-related protein
MKYWFLTMAMGLGLTSFSSETDLSWYKFDDGMQKAKTENKQILIDVFTDWCGWCKTMDAKTYTDTRIVDYLNEKYVLIKLNPETDGSISYRGNSVAAADFVRGMGVTGYPATAFFESDGRMITMVPGYMPADDFLPILRYIGEKKYAEMSFEDFVKSENKK